MPICLSLGDAQHPEFAAIWADVATFADAATITRRPSITAWFAGPQPPAPELILVWQQFSDEYPAADIARLLAAVPLARIVVIYGAWCEADGRTRTAWPAGLRVPVWQATARIRQEWDGLTGEGVPLPWTASREEAWLRDVAAAKAGSLSGPRISLELADPAYRIAVAERLAAAGATIVDSLAEANVVIVDLDPWSDVVAANLEARRGDFAGLRVIGLSAWITPELWAAAGNVGIATVVSKLDPVAIEAALLSG